MKNIGLFSLGIFIFFVSLLMINFVSAKMLTSEDNVSYDSEILNFFNNKTLAEKTLNEIILNETDSLRYEKFIEIKDNQTWLKVSVTLKDNSGLPITKGFSERDKWFVAKIDYVLTNLPKEEFNLSDRSYSGFDGLITKQGFENLINNSDIEDIILENTPLPSVTLDKSAPLINATTVWNNLNYTGKDKTVCVIDSGINWTHPDFGGCIGAGCKVLGGYDYVSDDTSPMDDNHHGTHVAGIAAAKGTINGTAPDAKY